MLKVFSYGGGVQSTAALVLAAQGRIDYRTFVFCNVGADSENPATLDYVRDVAVPYARQQGMTFVELVKRRRNQDIETIYERLTRPGSRSIGIPVRMSNGAPGRRSCTVDFKVKLVDQWLRKEYAAHRSRAVVGLGISLDEFTRMRTNTDADTLHWKTLDYPLIELRLDRASCIAIIRHADLPVPPKSSCWFCPYHSLQTWQHMRQDQPTLFAKAVALEQFINERRVSQGKDRVWLSSRLKPLAQVTTDYQQSPLFEEEAPCESGYCFV